MRIAMAMSVGAAWLGQGILLEDAGAHTAVPQPQLPLARCSEVRCSVVQ